MLNKIKEKILKLSFSKKGITIEYIGIIVVILAVMILTLPKLGGQMEAIGTGAITELGTLSTKLNTPSSDGE